MSVKLVVACAVAIVLTTACGIEAAPAAVVYFGNTPAIANGGGGCSSDTDCTFFQAEDTGSPSWAAPSSGVITSFSMRAGSTLASGDSARLKVFRPGGGSTWQVVGESTPGTFFSYGSPALRDTFPARVTVKAGDRIGATVHLTGNTAWKSAGVSGEVVAMVDGAAPPVGATLTPSDLFASADHMNLDVTIEPDADGDGFGDDTQDLCPGDPAHGDSGCSGVVVGSNFQVPYNSNTGCAACTYINSAISTGSPTSQIDGVLVRWRTLTYSAGQSITMSVLRPEGSGLRVVSKTDLDTGTSPNGIVVSPPQRIPVKAGDRLGIEGSTANFYAYNHGGVGSWALINPTVPLGALATAIPLGDNFQLLFGADVEPDIDGDGFGDQTQDLCPTDPATQAVCPQPVLKGFKFSPSRFRVNAKGKSIGLAKTAKGSAIKLSLDRASRVTFVVTQRATGRRSGGKCRRTTSRNRNGRKCTYNVSAWTFVRTLPAGATKLPFSGRVKKRNKTRTLPAANYVVTAQPTSTLSGTPGKTQKTTIKIVK